MQYIEKQPEPPAEWGSWFSFDLNDGLQGDGSPKTISVRSHDYKKDYGSFDPEKLAKAKAFLLNEQHGLCAYCQTPLKPQDASIEHLIPKSENPALSTNYHNLVAVCNRPQQAHAGADGPHCDKARLSKPILPLPLYRNLHAHAPDNKVEGFRPHKIFAAKENGEICPKDPLSSDIITQAEAQAYIDALRLNHPWLVEKRKEAARALLAGFSKDKKGYWSVQCQAILKDEQRPYRQFLLLYVGRKLGKN